MKVFKPNHDFQEFLAASEKRLSPPEHMQNNILEYVKSELQPSHHIVFSKLIGIHTFIGILTLTFCPQFTMSITHNQKLYHFFSEKKRLSSSLKNVFNPSFLHLNQ